MWIRKFKSEIFAFISWFLPLKANFRLFQQLLIIKSVSFVLAAHCLKPFPKLSISDIFVLMSWIFFSIMAVIGQQLQTFLLFLP